MSGTDDHDKIAKILERTSKKLEKDMTVSLHGAGDPGIAAYVPFGVSSGIPELDLNLGGKCGLPAGKIIEYYGFEMCGKTTAALHAIAECQRKGGMALFIDTEQSFSAERATDIGVDITRLAVASAYTIEAIFNCAEEFIASVEESGFKGPVLIVVDSVTAVPTEFDADNEITKEARVGQEAKQIRRGVRRLQGMLSKAKLTTIFINHNVSKIGGMAFARQSQSAGGHAIKFFAAVRVEFINAGKITAQRQGEKVRLGQKIKLRIDKLKNAELMRDQVDELRLLENGFDMTHSLFCAAEKTGFITKPTKTGKVYVIFKDAEHHTEFTDDEWPRLVSELGGYRKVYDMWVEHGKVNGILSPWGS